MFGVVKRIIVTDNKYKTNVVLQRLFLKLRKKVSICRHDSSTSQKVVSSLNKERIDLSKYPPENIRNFSIIAHIDHGKSTLADRILEITGTINPSEDNVQVLDKLPVERERGITVKAQTASIFYEHNQQSYLLNLIDTPGHVDFTYEVSRSLSACQGVVLLVDANQGIQAQTIANFYLAFGADLIIIPVLNKIDLKNAKPEEVALQMKNTFEIEETDIVRVSAKFGTGVEKVLHDIIEKIPPPGGNPSGPLRALLFDMWYDKYRGVIALIAVVDGTIKTGDTIESSYNGKTYEVKDAGIMHPEEMSSNHLLTGQVGYIVPNVHSTKELHIGDTFHHAGQKITALPGFKPAKPMVFAGVYPVDQSQNLELRKAVEKLTLNDASVTIAVDSSPALGQGWRLGFLGLLHMDVFNQRLEQEYGAEVIFTTPSVPYKARLHGGKKIKKSFSEEITITNPLHFPEKTKVAEYLEPFVIGTIITPDKYMGKVISLCLEKRGIQKNSLNIDNSTVMMTFKLPLNEIIIDFFDELKRFSSGFASFDYEECGYEPSDLTKLTIILNGKLVEELTCIVHVSKARTLGKRLCEKLKESIPQQMFEIAVQASVDNKIIARETVKALRKNVLAKCYGGDISRKMKLLKRQAEGKKRMRMIGNVEVPRDIFIKVLRK